MGRTILVTGSEGYLASQLIDRLLADEEVDRVIGVDIRESSGRAATEPRYTYIRASVTDPALRGRLSGESIGTVVHTAWTFNPTHDVASQDAVDIAGTQNILNIVEEKRIPHFFYLGSTTCYGPLPVNPSSAPFLSESDWEEHSCDRMTADYRYSRNKAIVDLMVQEFGLTHPGTIVGWIRGAIVIGPKTRNVVSYVAESPFTFGLFMFRVRGYDPPMQYVSEQDMLEVLFRSTMERWPGPVNVAGQGTVRYSEVIGILGRREVVLPSGMLYPVVRLLWELRIFKFPPSLLDLIRYPWVADISRLQNEFGFTPKYTSREALEQFASARLRS